MAGDRNERTGGERRRRLAVTLAVIGLVVAGAVGPAGAVVAGGHPAAGVDTSAVTPHADPAPGAVGDDDGVTAAAVRTTVSTCQRLDGGGIYELAGNVTTSTFRTCLAVNGSDVVVDGNGYTVSGAGTGIAVGVVTGGASYTNVTVRNVTVRGVQSGVDVNGTTGALVTDVRFRDVSFGVDAAVATDPVVRDVVGETTGSGVVVSDSLGAQFRNVTVIGNTSTGGPLDGVVARDAFDARLSNVTVTGPFSLGLDADGADNLTVRSLAVTGARIGLLAQAARRLDADGLSVTGVDTAFRFGLGEFRTTSVESGVVANATVRNVSTGGTYVDLDDSNDVTATVGTPNGTVTLRGSNVSLVPVRATPPAPAAVRGTVGNTTATGADPAANLTLSYPATVDESTVALYRTTAGTGSWTRLADGAVTRLTASDRLRTTTTTLGTVGAFGDRPTVDGCTRLNRSGTYVLAGNVTGNTSGTCVAINASNVTVDGNGYALVGNGSGTGVGVVRPGLANVTVRNLSVANVSNGVDLGETDDATVADVAVAVTRFGVDVSSTDRVRVRDVTVTGDGGAGLFAIGARDGRATDLAVAGRFSAGTNVQGSSNLTVEGSSFARVLGVVSGVRATDFTLRDARVVEAGAAPLFSFRSSTESSVVESAVVDNVTLVDPRFGLDGRARYVALDGSNIVQVTNLTTPNGTVGFAGVNASTVSVDATPPPPGSASVAGSLINVSADRPDASATFRLRAPVAGVDPSSVALYCVDRANDSWDRVPDANVTRVPSLNALSANTSGGFGVYGVFADPLTVDGCTVVNASGVYTLTGDVSTTLGPGDTCLAVNASGVTVDGAGRTLAANGSGTGVGVVRRGLTNVTVHNLTVRNVSKAVDLSRASAVRVTGVTASDVTVTGVDARTATDVTVLNTAVDGTGSEGVQLLRSDEVLLRNVTVDGGFFNGVGLARTTNATLRAVGVRNATTGLYLFGVTGVDARGIDLGGTRDPIRVATAGTPQTATVESGVVSDVVVTGQPATYVKRLDATNELRVLNLTTPDGSFAAVNGTNVSLEPSLTRGTTLADPNLTVSATVARATVSGESDGRLAVTVPYPTSLNDSDVGLYRFNASAGNFTANAAVGGRPVTVNGAADTLSARLTPGTYAVFAVNRTSDGPNGSLPLGERLFPTGVPASSTGDPPTDVDGDGKLEDVDGNGRFGFTDVIEFVFSQQNGDYASLTTEQTAALDFDGNGRVTFVDVIDLVFELQGQ
jgi:hypothetical protein